MTFAPKTAALEMPNVAGEAIGFFKEVCITRPERASPPPIIKAATFRGSIIFCMILIEARSPCPNKPLKHRENDIFVGVMKKERKNRRIVIPKSKSKAKSPFFFSSLDVIGISLLLINPHSLATI